jgi:RimJ/RimL family protein N-acetyltransferase
MLIVADGLKGQIEAWALGFVERCELIRLARAGRLPPRALALYLESLRYLFLQGQALLGLGALRCEELDDPALAAYFRGKLREESGHDRWAEQDLLGLPVESRGDSMPARGALELAALQRRALDRHPLGFAVYILWAEYFTALVGDRWLEAFARSGFQPGSVTALSKHVEADRVHAALGFAEVERLWRGQPAADALTAIVAEAASTFERFCDEICRAAAPRRLSTELWGIDWNASFPLDLGDGVSAHPCTFDDCVPFVREHYSALFEAERSAFPMDSVGVKQQLFYGWAADCFEFRSGGRAIGLIIGNPSDASTYYIRSAGVLPEFRNRGLMQRFVAHLLQQLRAAGVERVETDTSPANLVTLRIFSRLCFNVSGTIISDRWGVLMRLTRHLSEPHERFFLERFCNGVKYQLLPRAEQP